MIFEIINLLYISTLLVIINHFYDIKKNYMLILYFHLISIFFFNGFLFPSSYMPDQENYLLIVQNIRNFDFFNDNNFLKGNSVYISSLFFAFFPIPFLLSLHSIGMVNFMLYLFIFVFMHKKGFFQSKTLIYFYLVYPSLLLYSSLALRDMLIFCIMFFGTYFILVTGKKFWGGLSLLFLFLIKFQNSIIYILALFLGSMLKTKKTVSDLVTISLLVFLLINFSNYFSLEQINSYRLAFYTENMKDSNIIFIGLNSYYELFFSSFSSAFVFMFRPLPWEEPGLLQLLQFIENCGIAFLFGHIFYQNIKHKLLFSYEIKTLNIILIIALIIYGLVTYNSGTAVRYKFPFIAVYIIFSYYFIHQFKKCTNQ